MGTCAAQVAVIVRVELECIPVVLPQIHEFHSVNKASGRQKQKFFRGLLLFTHLSFLPLGQSLHSLFVFLLRGGMEWVLLVFGSVSDGSTCQLCLLA